MFRGYSAITLIFILIAVGLFLRFNAGVVTITNSVGPQLVNFIRALTGTDTLTGQAQYARS